MKPKIPEVNPDGQPAHDQLSLEDQTKRNEIAGAPFSESSTVRTNALNPQPLLFEAVQQPARLFAT